jgi:hypothetical protein
MNTWDDSKMQAYSIDGEIVCLMDSDDGSNRQAHSIDGGFIPPTKTWKDSNRQARLIDKGFVCLMDSDDGSNRQAHLIGDGVNHGNHYPFCWMKKGHSNDSSKGHSGMNCCDEEKESRKKRQVCLIAIAKGLGCHPGDGSRGWAVLQSDEWGPVV